MIKYLFFDTETTGLPKDWKAPIASTSNWPRLVQIAWITTDDSGCILTESEFIIYPSEFTIPTAASNIHGITTDIAKNKGVELFKVLQNFNEALEEAQYIVAHNISFDEKIIGAEFYRKKIKTSLFEKERICTMESSTNYCALPGKYGYKWPTLSELHFKLFGNTFQEAHNALIDIRATHKCFWKLVDNGIVLYNQRNALKQTVNNSIQEKISKINQVNENHKLEILDENKEYVEIWRNLPKVWKEQIISHMPKRKNPDNYFPFDEPYLPSMSLEGSINNEEASDLKKFFHETSSFVTGTEISSLEPILNFKNLQHLIIGKKYEYAVTSGNKNIKNLDSLRYLITLKSLDCQSCPITDLSPLTDLQALKSLDCQSCPITDLSPLAKLRALERLDISHTEIRSIEPIKKLKKLKSLRFICVPVSNISALSNLTYLETLKFGCTTSAIYDISVLANLTNLKELSLTHNPISDLSPLRNLINLESLYLSWTKISDLEPISNLHKIKYLWIHETNVHSLAPLTNLKELVRFDFDKTPVTNIRPLLNLPNLQIISCVDNNLSNEQLDLLKQNYPHISISSYKTKKPNSGCLGIMAVIIIIVVWMIINVP